MKIALYFILFVGFMITVSIVDRITDGPLMKLDSKPVKPDSIVMSTSETSKTSREAMTKVTSSSKIYERKYKEGDARPTFNLTKNTEIKMEKVRGKEKSERVSKATKPRSIMPSAGREVIYKGDEYPVLSFSN